ncbi:MAG: hypothetical protein ACOCP4_04275 [Candidatus Woesearchaeota archaeon]
MKKLLLLLALTLLLSLTACDTDATIVSENLSKDAEQFKIERRIIFYNGITDAYMFEMQGRCSIEADMADEQLEVTCKIGEDQYQKHFLGLSDNTTYIVEHLGTSPANEYRYKIIFKPESIIPVEIDKE